MALLAGCAGGDEPGSTTTTTATATATSSTTTAAPSTTSTAAAPGPRFPRPATAPEAASAVRAGGVGEQLALRALLDHADWVPAVLAGLDDSKQRDVLDDVAANRELRALVAAPKDTLPPWRIVEPKPAAELRRYYDEAGAATGVPWEYLAAVHLVETRMGRLRGTSTAGAQGPMQFLPATWAAYGGGGDIQSDHDAIRGAANYLRANGGGRGDLANALWHYNHSEHYVHAVTLYAERMRRDPGAYERYWGWQVVYWTTLGDVVLPVGYEATDRQPVSASAIASIEGAK
jgi:membrane-bound lytic murein transglycosylase B